MTANVLLILQLFFMKGQSNEEKKRTKVTDEKTWKREM